MNVILLELSQHLFVLIGFFVAFVAFVFVTRGRRSISNILAWLLFIFLIPYVGIPLFLIIGQRKLNWVLDKKRIKFANRNRIKKPESHVELLLNTFGIMPPSQNNQVQLLADGEAAYQTIIKLIDQAKSSILISTYRIANDEVGSAIFEALVQRAKQGVQVCLLLDTIGNFGMFPKRKLNKLRKAGGCVRHMMPLFHTPFRGRMNLRNHRKIMLFDDQHAIIGGMNLTKEYLGPTPDKKRWIDLSFLLQGDVVTDLFSIFESDWQFAASNMESKEYQRPEIQYQHKGQSEIQTLASGPDTIGDPLYDAIITSIYKAKQHITFVTPYFVLDDALQKAVFIALRGDVEVNIILPRKSNHKIPDLVRSISLRKLHSEGANIYFSPKMLHAKLMMFDHHAIIGSANLDLRSLLLNFEVSCILYTRKDIQQLEKWVENVKQNCSTNLKKPSLMRMWLEDAAQLIKPLL